MARLMYALGRCNSRAVARSLPSSTAASSPVPRTTTVTAIAIARTAGSVSAATSYDFDHENRNDNCKENGSNHDDGAAL